MVTEAFLAPELLTVRVILMPLSEREHDLMAFLRVHGPLMSSPVSVSITLRPDFPLN
jgi:hypothetical protein